MWCYVIPYPVPPLDLTTPYFCLPESHLMWQLQSQHFIWTAIVLRTVRVTPTPESKNGTRTYCGVTLKHLRRSLMKITMVSPH
jgi:hypothetical protein